MWAPESSIHFSSNGTQVCCKFKCKRTWWCLDLSWSVWKKLLPKSAYTQKLYFINSSTRKQIYEKCKCFVSQMKKVRSFVYQEWSYFSGGGRVALYEVLKAAKTRPAMHNCKPNSPRIFCHPKVCRNNNNRIEEINSFTWYLKLGWNFVPLWLWRTRRMTRELRLNSKNMKLLDIVCLKCIKGMRL